MRYGLTDAAWSRFKEEGYLRLGRTVDEKGLSRLQARIDEIMMGTAKVDYSRMLMQMDSIPGVSDKPGPQTKGHKLPSLAYRKIEGLEYDSCFLSFMQDSLFRHICERAYGLGKGIASYRAMFMNKPAGEGTFLVWHQDRWTSLDRDPLITIWTALDPATEANGCVWVTPGRHQFLINPEHNSGFLNDEQAELLVSEVEPVPLEVEAGESVLLHNHLPHSSGVNKTSIARRALSVCYMDSATVSKDNRKYPVLYGPGALSFED